jgi:UDP-N-acetylmuramyl pentapeptide phosphotransferase/UDP-N-acetylglucosamine-1-phosphate transferase
MLSLNVSILSTILFLTSFVVSYNLIGKIRGVVIFKRILDNPNERSSHSNSVPNLGGMAFFIVFMLSFYFIEPYDNKDVFSSMIPGVTILFIVGLKDDLVVLSPFSKLLAQIIASLFLVLHPSFIISSLNGFIGLENIPLGVSLVFAILIMVAVINAINLIDGIDGLAATLGIVMLSGFAWIFYMISVYVLFLLAVVMVACLLAFLRFNLSREKKIFMGDTGSMILGFIIGAMALNFLAIDFEAINRLPFQAQNLPFVVVAILIVPLFDTLRVFALRILNRKSPFSPDRNHIHHILIDRLNISHKRASFFIGLVSFLFMGLFSLLSIRTNQIYITIVLAGFVFATVTFFFLLHNPTYLHRMRLKNKKNYLKFKRRNVRLP